MKLSVCLLVGLLLCIIFPDVLYSRIHSARETANSLAKTFLKIGRSGRKLKGQKGQRGRPGPGARPPSVTKSLQGLPGEVDLLFILDGSGSIRHHNFILAKTFIKELLRYFNIISPSTTRVGMISYSTLVRTDFQFKDHLNRECVYKALDKVSYMRGMTATGPALRRAKTLFQSATSGARQQSEKVIFLLTDGKSNRGEKPSVPAGQLKASGIEIFALGIGNSINQNELNSIGSSTSPELHVQNFQQLQNVINQFDKDPYDTCSGYGTKYDECGRRCRCVGRRLKDCCRVRKDFPSMSITERERYISTLKIISTQQPYKTKYDSLIKIHIKLFNTSIHQKEEFLPWHRLFILKLENILREVDCRVTVPYWDWSLWSHNPWSSINVWHSGNRGYGGNGGPGGSCVQAGPFRNGIWSTTTGACLRRNFQGNPPDSVQVQYCLSLSSFRSFENFLRVNLHNVVHNNIGGTMFSYDSANAPEFTLHHGFVDKIWADWQKKSHANKYAHFPGRTYKLEGSQYTPGQLVDLRKQPGCVQVCYDEPTVNSGKRVKSFLRGLSRTQLVKIERLPFSSVSTSTNDFFNVSPRDRLVARLLETAARKGVTRRGRPGRPGSKKTTRKLTGIEKTIGFKLVKPTVRLFPSRSSPFPVRNRLHLPRKPLGHPGNPFPVRNRLHLPRKPLGHPGHPFPVRNRLHLPRKPLGHPGNPFPVSHPGHRDAVETDRWL